MKKYFFWVDYTLKNNQNSRFFNIMRLFLFLTFTSIFSLFAENNHSQNAKVTLSRNNCSIGLILNDIESQVDYLFIINSNVDTQRKASIKVKDTPVSIVLDKLFRNTNVHYVMEGSHIILSNHKSDVVAVAQQQRIIRGKIVDETGEPLIGVSVLIKGTNNGTITDSNGEYIIKGNISKSSVLEITYIGMKKQEVLIGSHDQLDIRMIPESELLDEVVVVGYGTQKKVNLTGAVSYIDYKQIENRPVANLGQALQGSIPNLNVSFNSGQPGIGTNLNIRGYTSINSGAPLILIDGIESSIESVNPRDVESVSVLKDAASSAIYGARAPFGVILITTKHARQGTTKVNVNSRFSFSKQTTSTDYITTGYDAAMLADEFMRSYNGNPYTKYTEEDYEELKARRNDSVEDPLRPWTVIKNIGGKDRYTYYANFDWYDYLVNQSRPTFDNNISVSGGSEMINYIISGNFNTQKGIYAQNTDTYQTGNLHSKIQAKVTKWFQLSLISAFNSNKYTAPGLGHGNNFPNYTFHAMPFIMPYNPDGSHVFQTPVIAQQPTDGANILVKDGTSKSTNNNKIFNNTVVAQFTLLKGLTLTGQYSFKYSTKEYMERTTKAKASQTPGEFYDVSGSLFQNKLSEQMSRSYYHNIDVYFNYDYLFHNHHLYGVAGFNYEQNHYKAIHATKMNIQSDKLNDFNLGDVSKDVTLQGGRHEWAVLGYFGRLGYDYKGKYLGEVNLRWDASSRFPKSQRSGLFPSVSLGYRVSSESFFEPLKKVISNLKIRGSYGMLGNQAVSNPYPYIQTISMKKLGGYLIDGDFVTYASVSAPPAERLTWEKVIHKNLGVDIAFFDDRLQSTLDLYIRDTKDMLVPGKQLPAVYGTSAPQENAANLRTKGFELTVGWNDQFTLLSKPFQYNVQFSLADNKSVITKYDNKMKDFTKSSYYEGMELGEIWGYHITGFFETDEQAKQYQEAIDHRFVCKNILETAVGKYKGLQAGDLIYADLDHSGRIDDGKKTADDRGDMRIIGNSRPRFLYGINVGFNWYGFDVSSFFQGIGRQHCYPDSNAMLFWGGYARPYASFVPKNFTDDIWTPEHPDSYFPKLRGYSAKGDASLGHVNDRYLQNLAYCRLKNFTIGYTLPGSFSKTINIEKIRIYFSGDNLLTWTKLRSNYIDPEQFASSRDGRTYPFSKTFSFGLDISF